jgi:hypothetical protein
MDIYAFAEKINDAAHSFRVGKIQQFRAKIHGRRSRTSKIFSPQTTFETEWGGFAFHDGGRTELQYNVGVYNAGRSCRYGVAFSFERTQTLPDPISLWPKVERFNEWVRTSGKLLTGYKMWHYDPTTDERSDDYSPREIGKELVDVSAFVFLGKEIAQSKMDVDRVLQDLNTLYPLYQFVESEPTTKIATVKFPEEVEQSATFSEGSVEKVLVNRYERDSRAKEECKRHYGTICVLCGFDFVAKYGELMEGFIHVHHIKQLARLGANYRVDPIRDLRPVCPNCHAVLHSREPCYSLDQVFGFLRSQQEG